MLANRHPMTNPPGIGFYRRHSKRMTTLLALVLAADALIAILGLRPAILRDGLIPLAGVLVYLATLHWSGQCIRIPKEIAAAILFTAGTFLTAWATLPCPGLAWAALAFFILCLANIDRDRGVGMARASSVRAASLHALAGAHLFILGPDGSNRVRPRRTQPMVRVDCRERRSLRGAVLAWPPPSARSASRPGRTEYC